MWKLCKCSCCLVLKLATTQSDYQRINDIWKLYKISNKSNKFTWVYEWMWSYYTANTDIFLPFMWPTLWWPEQEYSSSTMSLGLFDVQRAVQPTIISIVKPTRSINVSNLFYFGMAFCTFRTVFPSIIRSSRLYIQQYLFDKCLLLYVQSWTPGDGRKDRPKHVECHSKIK